MHIDTRVIAATHRNLELRIADGSFREDLFYRLNVFPIRVPPLRERVEDIPLLVWRFVAEFAKTFGKRIECVPRENLVALQRYAWPGNIRELRNVIERAMIVSTGPRLAIPLPAVTPKAADGRPSEKLVDVEREHIRSVLDSSRWRVRGVGGAAEVLGAQLAILLRGGIGTLPHAGDEQDLGERARNRHAAMTGGAGHRGRLAHGLAGGGLHAGVQRRRHGDHLAPHLEPGLAVGGDPRLRAARGMAVVAGDAQSGGHRLHVGERRSRRLLGGNGRNSGQYREEKQGRRFHGWQFTILSS